MKTSYCRKVAALCMDFIKWNYELVCKSIGKTNALTLSLSFFKAIFLFTIYIIVLHCPFCRTDQGKFSFLNFRKIICKNLKDFRNFNFFATKQDICKCKGCHLGTYIVQHFCENCILWSSSTVKSFR
jgi:hypothetical protein